MNYRQSVKAIIPQARYLNLNGAHCIDDDPNDRYLSYSCASRYMAWKEAYAFLEKYEASQ